MSKIWSPVHPRIVWTLGAATLAIAAGPAIVVLVLKALGFVHAAALHTGLLDVGQNVSPIGAGGQEGGEREEGEDGADRAADMAMDQTATGATVTTLIRSASG